MDGNARLVRFSREQGRTALSLSRPPPRPALGPKLRTHRQQSQKQGDPDAEQVPENRHGVTKSRITRLSRTTGSIGSDVFRHLFERIITACMAAGLVRGEGFALDASVMEANASRYHGKAPDTRSSGLSPSDRRARSTNILGGSGPRRSFTRMPAIWRRSLWGRKPS
jgi:hypothetical protein